MFTVYEIYTVSIYPISACRYLLSGLTATTQVGWPAFCMLKHDAHC